MQPFTPACPRQQRHTAHMTPLPCRAPGRTGDLSILGARRKLVVAVFMGLGLLLLYRASALWPLGLGLALGWSLVAAHACLKVPNLKTRLASAQAEFRAQFRGYQRMDDNFAHAL